MANTFTTTPITSPLLAAPFITSDTLNAYLGTQNVTLLSTQGASSDTPNTALLQTAIAAAIARVTSVLGQPRCRTGTFFAIPFTVGGVPLAQASWSTALPLLQLPAHQYAGFILNTWRVLESVPGDESALPGIFRVGRGWEKNADEQLEKIVRWAEGETRNASYVDLDLNPGAVVGRIYQRAFAPKIGRATVGPSGLPDRPLIDAWPLPWSQFPLPSGWC